MSGTDVDFLNSFLYQSSHRCYQCSAGINHIIHNKNLLPFDFAYYIQYFSLISTGSSFIYDSQRSTQPVSISTCSPYPSHIGRENYQILKILTKKIINKHGGGKKMVYLYIKKPLNLSRVKIYSKNSICTCCSD